MIRLLLFFLVVSCASAPKKRTPSPLIILDHTWFKVHYDPTIRLARYVEYNLKREDLLQKLGKRKDHFRPDPILEKKKLPLSTPEEYKKTGFDRGHLAPAADFSFSQEANDETFVMSNIAPQTKLLNRGAWLRLEIQVRKWACGEGKLSILTGPVVTAKDPTLPSGLIIPQKFFKIVIDETPPRKARAFVHTQKDPKNSMKDREVTVAEVEKLTGITFPREFPRGQGEWKSEDCLP